MPSGESATLLSACHGQLHQVTYSAAEPTTSRPDTASAVQVAPGPTELRRSKGMATRTTLARLSAAASRTKVIIGPVRPLRAAHDHRGAASCDCAPRASTRARRSTAVRTEHPTATHCAVSIAAETE